MYKTKIKKVIDLFFICFLIGAQMFGSGMAVIPILQREFIDKRKMITNEELLDIMSISQCTPGAYTVNIVTFIGNKYCGFIGGMMSAIGLTIIPIITIILFTAFYEYISELEFIRSAMVGITVSVFCLIINSFINLWKSAIVSKTTFILFTLSFVLYFFSDINIIFIIFIMGILNLLLEKYVFPKIKKSEGKA
ncbi:MAG: chromate transporter [Clostridia bacterium]|nr:chromate transporter [Clostridia bacterium]